MRFSTLVVLILWAHLVHGQYAFGELRISDVNQAWFLEKIGIENTALVSGKYYETKVQSKSTHNFLDSRGWKKGTISVRNKVYSNVNLMYVLDEDLILTNNPRDLLLYNQPIIIEKAQVSWFEIAGRRFENKKEFVGVPSGYYEVILKSTSFDLYVARRKMIQITSSEVIYSENNTVVIDQGSSISRVNNRRSLIKLFPEVAKPLKSYLVKNHMRKLDETHHNKLHEMAIYLTELLENTK
jgi:hypothetical protein